MEKRLIDFSYNLEEEDGLLSELPRSLERLRAKTQAKLIRNKIDTIKKDYKKKMVATAEETKSSLNSAKGQIDSSMSGSMSKKVKASAETKIAAYGDLLD